MNTRMWIVTRASMAAVALVVLATGCSKKEEASMGGGSADAGHAASMAAVPSASAAPSASASASAMAMSAAPASSAIPSQADESIAAAKEIDKTNYKAALSTLEAQLK